MPRDHRRFMGMQRGQQRDQKQIAVVKTERPALTLVLLQPLHAVRNVIAQMAQGPDLVAPPGHEGVGRTRGTQPADHRKRRHHEDSRLITRRRTSHSPAISAPISR